MASTWYNDPPSAYNPNSGSSFTQDGESFEERDMRLRRQRAMVQQQENQVAMQDQAMAAQNQQQVSQWEASRAKMFHPYDDMPVERMALDQHSPMFAPVDKPAMTIGDWAGSAPPPIPEDQMPGMGKQPIPQSQWNAALGSNGPQMTPQDRSTHDMIVSYTDELRALNSARDRKGNLPPDAQSRANTLQTELDRLRGSGQSAPPPVAAPSPNPANAGIQISGGGPPAGAVKGPSAPAKKRKEFPDGSAVEAGPDGNIYAISRTGKRKPITPEQAKQLGF